jgi:putative lipoprotein
VTDRVQYRVLFVALVTGALVVSKESRASDEDPWLGRDKFDHFVVSSSIASETYLVAAAHVKARGWALVIAGATSLAIGAAKEAWDLVGHGDPSWRDLTWDVFGTAAGLAFAWGVDLAIRGVDEDHPLLRAPVVRF